VSSKDPAKRKAATNRHYAKNREAILEKQKAYRLTPERLNVVLKHRYGISLEIYRALEIGQHSECMICGQPETEGKRLSVDHDHDTGQIRGLLCRRCNRGIGIVLDNPVHLRQGVAYLEGI
jgi:hypothetical protein